MYQFVLACYRALSYVINFHHGMVRQKLVGKPEAGKVNNAGCLNQASLNMDQPSTCTFPSLYVRYALCIDAIKVTNQMCIKEKMKENNFLLMFQKKKLRPKFPIFDPPTSISLDDLENLFIHFVMKDLRNRWLTLHNSFFH